MLIKFAKERPIISWFLLSILIGVFTEYVKIVRRVLIELNMQSDYFVLDFIELFPLFFTIFVLYFHNARTCSILLMVFVVIGSTIEFLIMRFNTLKVGIDNTISLEKINDVKYNLSLSLILLLLIFIHNKHLIKSRLFNEFITKIEAKAFLFTLALTALGNLTKNIL
jgi:hypothetical protein